MKKIYYILFFFTAFFAFTVVSMASGTATLSVNRSSVENGGSVTATVTLRNTAAWNVVISSSGSTSGCSQRFVGDSGNGANVTKTLTVTCRSTSTGIINFSMSGDITSSNGVNTNVSGNRSVTVVQPTPKSSNNFLKSLAMEGIAISPEFNKNTLEYTAILEPNTTKVKITAVVEDAKATLSGVGEIDVVEGSNTIQIVVTAENGNQKTYVIQATVKELSPIEVTIGDATYSVIRKKETLESPNLFTETTVTIEGEEVPAFQNEVAGIVLVALKDSEGVISYYIYDSEKETYTKFYSTTFASHSLMIQALPALVSLPNGYQPFELKIGEETYEAYKKNAYTHALVYGVNLETGEAGLYQYDEKEHTVQRFLTEVEEEKSDSLSKEMWMLIGIGSYALLATIGFVSVLIFNQKKKVKKI